MLPRPRVIAALLMMALSPAALAQKSSGYMNLEDMSSVYGTQLAVFRVMLSETEAICPQQTGIFRILPNGGVTELLPVLRGKGGGWRMDETAAPDDFTYRRRVATDTCRLDIDISEQQRRNGEWMPLLSASRPKAIPDDDRKPHVSRSMSPAEIEVSDRYMRVRANAGNLLQGWTATFKSVVGFEEAKDCFDAIGTFQIDQSGVTLLFPAGLAGELNRFFIERVDVDADHSTLYLSRGSCRVGFTISASTFREGNWLPLPIAPRK
jgi:hypothetical protein